MISKIWHTKFPVLHFCLEFFKGYCILDVCYYFLPLYKGALESTNYLVRTGYFSVSLQLIKENVYLGKKSFYAESRFLFIISTVSEPEQFFS